MTGGFLGDFVKGRLHDRFPPRIALGIQTHRAIDSFSDLHPVFRNSTNRLRSSLGRYAPIAVDVIYDHCLARSWDSLIEVDLPQFCNETYAAWESHRSAMPESARNMADAMAQHRSFEQYHEASFIKRTLKAVSQRARKQNPLADAMPAIQEHLSALEADFLIFFPQLVLYVKETMATLTADQSSEGRTR